MNRRRYLELLGTTAGLSALAGCSFTPSGSGPSQSGQGERSETATTTASSNETTVIGADGESVPEPPVTWRGISFETVLDAVEDLGMDPTGSEPIDASLDDAYGPKTLVAFPPGKYLVTDEHEWKRGVSGFGLLGLGSDPGEVEFVFPPGNRGAPDPANYWFLRVMDGTDHLLENFTIQQTRDRKTGAGVVMYLRDGLRIANIELAGFNPKWDHDPGFGLLVALTTRDGVGVIENFTCTGGGVVAKYPKRKTPIAAFRDHVGELRVVSPVIAESGSHSLYVSRSNGCVRVTDGLFVNNDNTNLRMSGGGHPNKRSWAKNCRIVIDIDQAKHLPKNESYQGARGVWVESGGEYNFGYTDLLLDNVSVESRSNARPLPMLLVDHSHGAVTVKNSTFSTSVSRTAPVDMRSPKPFVDRPYGVTLQNVDVTTTANRSTTGYAVSIKGRAKSELRDTTISLPPWGVGGVSIVDSSGTTVRNTVIKSLDPTENVSPNIENDTVVGLAIESSRDVTLENNTVMVSGEAIRRIEKQSNT